ncbi:peptide/nickel transport system permease protein [Lysinibacillus parviboronicapiens]|uniref:Peptide/nickel transport system permease protein n=1 Tax=Lysinibacillus parviboronicapiens TaxID=436516 RepID=A0ABV2PEX1_9BACI|nr:ABC transporter permease [Lysinibacillus parviboronicapiens]
MVILKNRSTTKEHVFFFTVYQKLMHLRPYMLLLFLLSILVHPFTYFLYRKRKNSHVYKQRFEQQCQHYKENGSYTKWKCAFVEQEQAKARFFGEQLSEQQLQTSATSLAEAKLQRIVEKDLANEGLYKQSYLQFFGQQLKKQSFIAITFVPAILFYVLLLLFANPFLQYVIERILQSFIVIIGVATLVFTILYLSPFDPARNLLGVEATPAQVANFNRIYGLDQPYLSQLWHALSGLFTFDLGTSFAGKEDITHSIANKFPITLEIALLSLLMAIAIAIPVGIISAVRPNSYLDYTFMFIALIGLSIPSFWQGLLFILTFALKLQWFPATYNPQNWLSLLMPVIVLGTSITASIARMTRSSMLEVIHEDYIITAKAKGLNEYKVITKHAIRNAMIPIITVIGLLFGGMLGGASVTEKVFNISGIGSYIVDKQFIPDIPAILGGVVYIAITISIVNLLIDILYAYFDPRIRSKMKKS